MPYFVAQYFINDKQKALMKKQQAIEIISQLPANEKVRVIIDTHGICVDSTLSAGEQLFWLENKFCSPWDENQQETDCVQLESSSFDFALSYNSVMNKESQTVETVEYTQEQQEQMWALHYETTQQIHVGYLSTTKGE